MNSNVNHMRIPVEPTVLAFHDERMALGNAINQYDGGCITILFPGAACLILTLATIGLKRTILRQRLEQCYKKSYAKRIRARRRRLRDMMNDPVLVLDLERRFDYHHPNDKQRVLQEMDALRTLANTEIKQEDENKGDERRRTTKSIESLSMLVTFFVLALCPNGETSVFAEDTCSPGIPSSVFMSRAIQFFAAAHAFDVLVPPIFQFIMNNCRSNKSSDSAKSKSMAADASVSTEGNVDLKEPLLQSENA
mmetsp:Transcript_13013/g.19744  ORF Transcript_13013/g.19744 Transcript_13013/m.19744 type:complete len:251 (+) Transcript_13013:56-808(+)